MQLDLATSALGTAFPHDLSHTIDRPGGLGQYLLLRFLTPMEVRTECGVEQCQPGTCLVYSPRFPQWYRGRNVGFRDDWCHITGRDVAGVLAQAGIIPNRLLHPRNSEFVPILLSEIRRETQRQEPHWREVMATILCRLLLQLGRAVEEAGRSADRPGELATERLREARVQIHERLADPWTVRKMAHLVGLSESRFGVCYRRCFGISPMEDLIRARLQHACWLLTNQHTAVQQAAEASGFRSIHYFSRLFHRRIGCPPREYAARQGQ